MTQIPSWMTAAAPSTRASISPIDQPKVLAWIAAAVVPWFAIVGLYLAFSD